MIAPGSNPRKKFEEGAPANYIAGLGRGAIGFTTRSDIGPARETFDPDFGKPPSGYVPGMGRAMGDLAREQGEVDGDKGNYNESNYDPFSGYSERLFNDTPYEKDDEEADRIYEAVDEHMDNRRKRRREQLLLEQVKKYRAERPKISEQFADLKRGLATVSQDEWEGIPEVGDHSLRFKQHKRADIFTPVPDRIIEGGRTENPLKPILDEKEQKYGGIATPIGGFQTVTDMKGLAEARGTVLSIKLDRMSDSVTGQTVVDPKGYLTDLNSLKISSDTEIGDYKKARVLLKSVTSTNPKHAPGWIAAARVEEFAGKIVQARKIIREGCDACPDNEDIWLEAARLHTPENAKAILANAVRNVPKSVKIWLAAADIEIDPNAKKIVVRRALEIIPNSVKLWKTAIELENVDDARIMLARAVECVPHSVDMWLALARLETYENARAVLNKAREAIPTELAIWITAAKLEEAHGNTQMIDRLIERAIISLTQYQVVIDREQWIKEAEAAEHAGAPLTCGAIIRHTINLGVEPEDRKRTWIDDGESALSRNSIETSRAIYAYALTIFPGKKSIWLRACSLEREHGTKESLEKLLKKAVSYCPQAEILWLMYAKEKWLSGDITGARSILSEAFAANPISEQVWYAAIKLEWENEEYERAQILLEKARGKVSTARIWMKSALLERELGNINRELELLDEAINIFPDYPKLYMMAGQACENQLQDYRRAIEYYQKGLQRCPESVPLWKLAAWLEEKVKGETKGRSILELARFKNPRNPELWLEAIRLERRAKNYTFAQSLMAKSLQECPNAGILWAQEILSAPRPLQKSKSYEAYKRRDDDPCIITAIARLFQKDKKISNARKWFDRAVILNPDLGDAWAYYFSFELQNGTIEQQNNVLQRCCTAEPTHGELWCSVTKRDENRRLTIEKKLKKVAAEITLISTNQIEFNENNENDEDGQNINNVKNDDSMPISIGSINNDEN